MDWRLNRRARDTVREIETREVDVSEVERLRADTLAAMTALAEEVQSYKGLLQDIKAIVDDEARRGT